MNPPNITEARTIRLFTQEWGDNFQVRFEKYKEESLELIEAIEVYNLNPSVERLEHLRDEFCDVQATFTHLASLMGLYQFEMLDTAVNKVKKRKTNPDYKRFPLYQVGKVGKADNYPTKFDVNEFLGLNFTCIPIDRIPYNCINLVYGDQLENSSGRRLQFLSKEKGYRLVTGDCRDYLTVELIEQEWIKI